MGLRFRKRLRLTLALALALCASYAFAGPSVRVSIDADGSGLILQAYTACLRNTPGVQVVPLGRPAEVIIVITRA